MSHLYPITADTKRQAFLYGSFVIEESTEGWECSIDGQDVIGATHDTVFEAIAAADAWLEAREAA